jgi:plasmid stabilization system protein ParE
MRRYKVVFAASAQEDIFRSYEWGCAEWGEMQARHWARNLRESVEKTLKIFPNGQPLAPESQDMSRDVRQVIVGRYRILFVVDGRLVTILHLRGAYHSKPDNADID